MKRNKFVNLSEYYLFRAALWKLRLLPYPWSRSILTFLFRVAGYGLGIRRDVATRQLSMGYPDLDAEKKKDLLRKIYHNMGLTVAEVYLLDEDKLIKTSRITGKSNVEEAFSLGRGALMATAHFGNWETARVLPLFDIPLSVVVKKQHNPYFDAYNNAIRCRHGVGLIDFKRGLRDILSCLYKNEMVAILADQDAGRSGLMLDFLGWPASHWKGVAKLSLRYKIPIVPGFALRTSAGNIDFTFREMIYHPELEDKEENYRYILAKVNKAIEEFINRYPEQWFWVHNRWKTAPRQEMEDGLPQ